MSILAVWHNIFIMMVGDPNAVNDIISNPMFAGSLESLSKVIQVCDSIFGFIVSFAGFFIISAAMLRNVVAGMYASNTKLFDKVNEVKNNFITGVDGQIQGGPAVIRGVGTIGVFLLRLLPDPKELSEFKDDTIEPRDYFLKAIPQMIGVVMIGVVIYNGYYKDLLGKTATLGCSIIERFILDVDPVEGFNKLLGLASQPDLASKEDTSVSGQLTYDIAYEMYHDVLTFYTDQTEVNARNKISTTLETWVSSQVATNCTPYLDATKWKYSIKIDRVLGQPALSNINKVGDEQVIQAWSLQMATLSIDTSKHVGEDWWLRTIVVWDRVRTTSTSSSGVVTDGQLQMASTIPTLKSGNNTASFTLIPMTTAQLSYLNISSGAKAGSESITKGTDGIHITGDVRATIKTGLAVTGVYYKVSSDSASVVSFISGSYGSGFNVYSPSKGTVSFGTAFALTTTTTT